MRRDQTEEDKAELSRGSAGLGVLSWRERAKLRSVEGFSPGRGPASSNTLRSRSCRSDRRGSASDELSGRNHGRLCESSCTWLGREENSEEGEEGRKEWQGCRQKNPDLVFLKPSSYIANAWSNMGLIHNG